MNIEKQINENRKIKNHHSIKYKVVKNWFEYTEKPITTKDKLIQKKINEYEA